MALVEEAPKKKKTKKIKRYTRKKSSKENIVSAVTVNEDAKVEEVAMSKEVPATQEEISLDDLFERGLEHTAQIIAELDKVIESGKINKATIEKIIPNKASTHGLECGQGLVINMTKGKM